MKKLIANLSSREKRFAVMEQDRLVKLEVVQPHHASMVGNIYVGKVTKVLPGMEAVFIDFGVKKNGFLHRDELPSFQAAKRTGSVKGSINHYVHEGEKLLVQVTRDESETKGAKLTGLIELSSTCVVYIYGIDYVGASKKISSHSAQNFWRKIALLHKESGEGLIIRTAMEQQNEDLFLKQLREHRNLMESLKVKAATYKSPGLLLQKDPFIERIFAEISSEEQGEVLIDDVVSYQKLKKRLEFENSKWIVTYEPGPENIFTHIQPEVERALKKIVWLKNGGYLIFEETEAFAVIDVNTGKFTGKLEKEQTIFETNCAATKEIARQLSLRNIGGIILIDFINMEEETNRRKIYDLMKKETRDDEMRVQVIGFTELGILQLTRKRTSPSLYEKLLMACPTCEGTGKVVSSETIAFRLERELIEYRKRDDEAVWIELNEAVAHAFFGENNAYWPVLEKNMGMKIFATIISDHDNRYRIKRFGTISEFEKMGASVKSC
jgi:ribonuclease G